MDHMNSRNVDLDVDLENGRALSDGDGDWNHRGDGSRRKKFFSRSLSGHMKIDGYASSGEGSSDFSCNSEGKLRTAFSNFFDKNTASEKRKNTSSSIPSKPPRPPVAPSLDESDMKWVREFSELAELKRKRVERLKKLRRMKNQKNLSSAKDTNTNLLALVVTTLFCLIVISQAYLGSHV